jgi:hypothetical protein
MKESAGGEALESGQRRASLGAHEQTFAASQLAHRIKDFDIGNRECRPRAIA